MPTWRPKWLRMRPISGGKRNWSRLRSPALGAGKSSPQFLRSDAVILADVDDDHPGDSAGRTFRPVYVSFYKKDKADGRITDEDVLELLECLRIKVMQYNFVGGGDMQRKKWAGLARWNNWVIGGVTPQGEDATNELSYLILEAARDCQTPHYTVTIRVHDKTPDSLLIKALEVVKIGTGMPAFVSDKSYIEYLMNHGVSLEDARTMLWLAAWTSPCPASPASTPSACLLCPWSLRS